MQQRDAWNGVNILKTAWDGKIAAALAAELASMAEWLGLQGVRVGDRGDLAGALAACC